MTPNQAYMIWKATGRADPARVPAYRERRAEEIAVQDAAALFERVANGQG